MKYYSVKRLDRRFVGGDDFRYRVEIDDHIKNPDKVDLYYRIQDWCRETWGRSTEVRHHRMLKYNNGWPHNEYWCFNNEHYHSYWIYLRGDEELMLFELRWPVDRQ